MNAITMLERDHVDTLLGELTNLAPANEAWGAKVTVMQAAREVTARASVRTIAGRRER